MNQLPVAVLTLDHDGVIIEANDLAQSWLGGAGGVLADLAVGEEGKKLDISALRSNPGPVPVLAGPEEKPCSLYSAPTGDGLLITLIDATEHRDLEARYNQSQKMQAIGQLAGGVAHDFNNLLTAILGHCELLLESHGPGEAAFADLIQIKQNSNRAANLVRQLLTFSRQQTLKAERVDLSQVLAEIALLLSRLIGEKVSLNADIADDIWPVFVDRGQLEQVIINLAVNARDAMPDGGDLKITAENENVSARRRGRFGTLEAGDYAVIKVIDSGGGIAPENLDKIFDPFFTTKEVGKGTGLGLATVYGIVDQSGGLIRADSEVGKGTCFTIYLPRHGGAATKDDKAEDASPKAEPAVALDRPARILLVEDERAVRRFAVTALSRNGYDVEEAEDGEDALEILEEVDEPFDLLITDVVMPNMDGPALYQEALKDQPDLKVLFVSGYAEEDLRKTYEGRLAPGLKFLSKPFTLKQLAREVRQLLGG